MGRSLFLLILPLLMTACGGTPEDSATPVTQRGSGVPEVLAEGTFQPGGGTAVTYHPDVVPAGATARVGVARTANGTTVRVSVTGLLPSRAYGAHLHTGPCAADPDAAGPHYQHSRDPEKPSVDPSFANPANEVWLDFTTDPQGVGSAMAAKGWGFDELSPPRSLVLHAELTRTAAGEAGTAGARVACLTLPTS